MKEVEKIFTEKYIKNSWLGSESRSGPGSSVNNNKKMIKLLEKFIIENDIKTITDCGCGDFNWMRNFNFELINNYKGIDIVDDMIFENNKEYSSEKIGFVKSNIIDEIPRMSDIILCKDVLFHLSYEDSIRALSNIIESKSKYLISTTFIGFENKNISTGSWRPINLEDVPFNLGKADIIWENIEDKKSGWVNKSIGIWKIN